MDTLTHALTGALAARCLAAGRPAAAGNLPAPQPQAAATEGRFTAPWDGRGAAPAPWQCVVVGLVAGAFPDADSVVQLAGDIAYLRHHRGITHSLLMAPLWAGLLAGVLAWAFPVTRSQRGGWKSLYLVALAALLVHVAGDWITAFGTMLLAPFSDHRFGLGSVFIIDLVFSGIVVVALLAAALWRRRRAPAWAGMLALAGWVGVTVVGQREALAFGERHARDAGIAAERVEALPRPASPFNWTVAVFDGDAWHVAHVNTRRTEALVAAPDDSFIRRFSAPYVPLADARWKTVPMFGDRAPSWVQAHWQHEAFGFYRWFAALPVLVGTEEAGAAGGEGERCAWFRDLRFEFPGRDESPFRYGLCVRGEEARVFRLEEGRRVPV